MLANNYFQVHFAIMVTKYIIMIGTRNPIYLTMYDITEMIKFPIDLMTPKMTYNRRVASSVYSIMPKNNLDE